MTATEYHYRADQELEAMALAWSDRDDALIDFSNGWTPTVKVAAESAPNTVLVTKTTGITLAATSPNYLIDWTAAEITALAAALNLTNAPRRCVVYAYCRRDSDSKDRVFLPGSPPIITIWPAPA